MNLTANTYGNLQVAPFDLEYLQQLTITQNINQHAHLQFTGIIPKEKRDACLAMTTTKTPVEVVKADQEETTSLFKGLVTDIKIQAVGEVHQLTVEALSASYLMDIELRSRSFQEQTMTYEDLIREVIANYQEADFIDTATAGAQLQDFTLQYQETDWQFLKRMASRFYTGLIPAANFNSPKFFFGIPKGKDRGNLEEYHYTVQKNLATFRSYDQNYIPDLNEQDTSQYQIQSPQILNIGDRITFQGRPLYLGEAIYHMEKGLFKHTYTFTGPSGLKQPALYNQAITGVSIQGQVLEVTRDKIKARLEIDEKPLDTAKAYSFPYSTIYASADNSGWYCMPETGGSVRIYFPNNQEKNCVALSSVSKDLPGAPASGGNPLAGGSIAERDRMEDPDIKSLRTKYGKEIILAPDCIIITGDGVSVTLLDGEGISIVSNNNINMKAEKDINIEAKKIVASAETDLNLTCQGHTVNMADNLGINGAQVRLNSAD